MTNDCCESENQCENKGIECHRCTRCWSFEDPHDWFSEKEGSAPMEATK